MPTSQNDILAKAQQLLADIKRTSAAFNQRTGAIVEDAQNLIHKLDAANLDEKIRAIERETVEKIDTATMEYAKDIETS